MKNILKSYFIYIFKKISVFKNKYTYKLINKCIF